MLDEPAESTESGVAVVAIEWLCLRVPWNEFAKVAVQEDMHPFIVHKTVGVDALASNLIQSGLANRAAIFKMDDLRRMRRKHSAAATYITRNVPLTVRQHVLHGPVSEAVESYGALTYVCEGILGQEVPAAVPTTMMAITDKVMVIEIILPVVVKVASITHPVG